MGPEHMMVDEAMQTMSGDYLIILGASVVILLVFPLLLYWGWKKGQFRDIEEAKFRMIEKEDEDAN